jgi:hypothetical protein
MVVLVILPIVVGLVASELFIDFGERTLLAGRGMSFAWERSRGSVAEALRAKGIASTAHISSTAFGHGELTLNARSRSLVPLAGPSRTLTVMCNEAGETVLYRSDEFGFNNPAGLWKPDSVDLILIGDSFTLGMCVPGPQQAASLIRRAVPSTLNLGGSGNGPLSELALLREYATPLRPKRVVWLFYEGNDMFDLSIENRFFLRRYLDPAFSQGLMSLQPLLDSVFLERLAHAAHSRAKAAASRDTVLHVLLLRGLRHAIGTYATASQPPRVTWDYKALEEVLSVAKEKVEGWCGRMYLAYLPAPQHFDRSVPREVGGVRDAEVRPRTLEVAKRLGIPVIDVYAAFLASPDPARLAWAPRTHYSPEGYRYVANAILDKINNDVLRPEGKRSCH